MDGKGGGGRSREWCGWVASDSEQFNHWDVFKTNRILMHIIMEAGGRAARGPKKRARKKKEKVLTSLNHRFSISIILTTAATRRTSTWNLAATALMGMPPSITSLHTFSRASALSTLWLRKYGLLGNGISGSTISRSETVTTLPLR